jgi:argininosuccinate lyase
LCKGLPHLKPSTANSLYDIAGSRAHAEMLMSTGVLTAEENAAIQQGLTDVLRN